VSAAGKRTKRAARRSKERERQRRLEALKPDGEDLAASADRDVGQQRRRSPAMTHADAANPAG
jgi:hypothetical protein